MKERTFIIFICEACGEEDESATYVSEHELHCFAHKEKEAKRRKVTGHLTIGQILEKCKKFLTSQLSFLPIIIVNESNDKYSGMTFFDGASYRGDYNQFAIKPIDQEILKLDRFAKNNDFIADMMHFHELMQKSLRGTYSGWKGGEFQMYPDTLVWVADPGLDSNLGVIDLRLSEDGQQIQLVINDMSESYEW